MRKLVSLMHVSLDGFVVGPNGEMGWIKMFPELTTLKNLTFASSELRHPGVIVVHAQRTKSQN